jgi:hypothetical protein
LLVLMSIAAAKTEPAARRGFRLRETVMATAAV